MSFFDGFDMNKVRSFMDKATAVVMQYSEMETKVRQVTNNDPWGSSATDMMDLARHTYNYQDFMEIMSTITKRLNEPVSPTWRQTYKALQLLEFLIINGSEQVIDDTKRRIYDVKGCQNYQYVDEKKKDQGINIRHRATKILDLLADDNLIREERKKAKENKSKYTGVSSSDMRSGGFSSSNGGYSSSGFGNSSSDSGRRTSGGGYRDSAYNSNSDSGFKDNNTDQHLPKVEKIPELPKPVAPAAPPVQNLLDFDADNDFSEFIGVPASNVNSSNFTSAAAPAGFANFATVPSPPAANTASSPSTLQFANFQSFQQPSTTSYQPQFATFPSASTTMVAASTFPSTNPTTSNAGFATFDSIPQAKPTKLAQETDDFGDFVDFTTSPTATTTIPSNTVPAKFVSDPISKLVSLDAFSLSQSNPKKDPGPSLNSLRTF